MISFISKKVIAIYSLNNFIIVFLFFTNSFAQEKTQDLYSFCFEKNVNLNQVVLSVKPFLLDEDVVTKRNDENCIDLATSLNRSKLVSKYLNKRYHVLEDGGIDTVEINEKQCRLELKTIIKKKISGDIIKIGKNNSLIKNELMQEEASTQELLLGDNKVGSFEYENQVLNVTCRKIGTDKADLIFSFKDMGKSSLSTNVIVKLNEMIDLGNIVKDLNMKEKMIGIPQTEVKNETGKVETKYELKLK